jgi:hypothetical protein
MENPKTIKETKFKLNCSFDLERATLVLDGIKRDVLSGNLTLEQASARLEDFKLNIGDYVTVASAVA